MLVVHAFAVWFTGLVHAGPFTLIGSSMDSDSEVLEKWLSQILADHDPTDWSKVDFEAPDDEEEGEGEGTHKSRLIWYFPTDEICNEYISNIDSRPEEEVP